MTTVQELMTIKLPKATKSYTPISHIDLVDFVKEGLDKRNLKVKNENFTLTKNGDQFFGQMGISAQDSEFNMALGFRNSYDKSMPVGFVSGAQVIVCSNMMFSGDVSNFRRHTSGMIGDLEKVYTPVLDGISKKFDKIKSDAELMKQAELQIEDAHRIFGEMLLVSEDYKNRPATIQQISDAVRLFKTPIHNFGNDTYWGMYNAFTEALKGTHPYNSANQYIKLHDYFTKKLSKN